MAHETNHEEILRRRREAAEKLGLPALAAPVKEALKIVPYAETSPEIKKEIDAIIDTALKGDFDPFYTALEEMHSDLMPIAERANSLDASMFKKIEAFNNKAISLSAKLSHSLAIRLTGIFSKQAAQRKIAANEAISQEYQRDIQAQIVDTENMIGELKALYPKLTLLAPKAALYVTAFYEINDRIKKQPQSFDPNIKDSVYHCDVMSNSNRLTIVGVCARITDIASRMQHSIENSNTLIAKAADRRQKNQPPASP